MKTVASFDITRTGMVTIAHSQLHLDEPTKCKCKGELYLLGKGRLYCINKNCMWVNHARLDWLTDKRCFNIKAVGTNYIRKWAGHEPHTIASFFDMETHEGLLEEGTTNSLTMYQGIIDSKNITLNNFLAALSIPTVGPTKISTLVKLYPKLELIENLTRRRLIKLIGYDSGTALWDFFDDVSWVGLKQEFFRNGVRIISDNEQGYYHGYKVPDSEAAPELYQHKVSAEK